MKRDLKAQFLGLTANEKLRAKQVTSDDHQSRRGLFKAFLRAGKRQEEKNLFSNLRPDGCVVQAYRKCLLNHFRALFGQPSARSSTQNWDSRGMVSRNLDMSSAKRARQAGLEEIASVWILSGSKRSEGFWWLNVFLVLVTFETESSLLFM